MPNWAVKATRYGFRLLSGTGVHHARAKALIEADDRVRIYQIGSNSYIQDAREYPYYIHVIPRSTVGFGDADSEYLHDVMSKADSAKISAPPPAVNTKRETPATEEGIVGEPRHADPPSKPTSEHRAKSDPLTPDELRALIEDVLHKRLNAIIKEAFGAGVGAMTSAVYDAFTETVAPALTAIKEGQKDVLSRISVDVAVRKMRDQVSSLNSQLATERGLNSEWEQEDARHKAKITECENTMRGQNDEIQSLRARSNKRTANDLAEMLNIAMPESVEDILELFATLFSDRIVVLPEAIDSATEWKINHVSDLKGTWNVLRAVAVDLWDLIFVQESTDPERDFKERVNLELALNESPQTQNDSRLMKQRKRIYNGGDIDITPHVKKTFRGNREFRVYFGFDHDNHLVVVGHCGHLETAGTRKMR